MPTLKLTDRSITALRAPHITGKQTLYWDTQQIGFAVLVSGKTNVKTFMAKGPLNGKAILKKLGRVGIITLDEARQAAREIHRDLGAGVDPRKNKTGSITLAEAVAAYIKNTDLAPRTRESYDYAAKRYFADWSDTLLKEITRDQVEARYRQIAEEIEARSGHPGKAAANAAMRTLRAVYNYELDKNPEMPPNPVRLKRQWHRLPPREGHLPADRIAAFYEAVMKLESPIGRDYLLLVLFTGLRRREAAALRWSEIDLAARTISIPADRNKSRRKFVLPLSDYVSDLLVARRAIGRTEFVFPAVSKSGHIEMPRYHLIQVAAATGIQVSVHDLRRTFITVAESCDVSPIALRALANHSIGSNITERYVQMSVERLREPAQRVVDRLKELCRIAEPLDIVRLVGHGRPHILKL